MDATNKVAKQQAELINRLEQFPTGKSRTGGKAGGYIDVVLDNPIPGQPKSVRAKCGGDCPPGAIQVIKADNGEYIALSPNAAQQTSSTTTRESSTKVPKTPQSSGNVKVLVANKMRVFEIESNANYNNRIDKYYFWKELWVCGTWAPKKIYDIPDTHRLLDAYIVNTGAGQNDYVVIARLFPSNEVHSNLLPTTPLPSGKGKPSIFVVIEKGKLTTQKFMPSSSDMSFWRYCGGGFMYSAGSDTSVNTTDIQYNRYSYGSMWNIKESPNWFGPTAYGYPMNDDWFLNFALSYLSAYYSLHYENSDNELAIVKPSLDVLPVNFYQGTNNLTRTQNKGFDTSSCWYFKSKQIKSSKYSTYFDYIGETPGNIMFKVGFFGDLCTTPNKNRSLNLNTAFDNSYGYTYEPIIVDSTGKKTLAYKQQMPKLTPGVLYDTTNDLVLLSDNNEEIEFDEAKTIGIDGYYFYGGGDFDGVDIIETLTNSIIGIVRKGEYNDGSKYHYCYVDGYTGTGGAQIITPPENTNNGQIVLLNSTGKGIDKVISYDKDQKLKTIETLLVVTFILKTLPNLRNIITGNYYESNGSKTYYRFGNTLSLMAIIKNSGTFIKDTVYVPIAYLVNGKKYYQYKRIYFENIQEYYPGEKNTVIKVLPIKFNEKTKTIDVSGKLISVQIKTIEAPTYPVSSTDQAIYEKQLLDHINVLSSAYWGK